MRDDFERVDIGKKVKEARIKKGMKQIELAEAIGVSNQFVCQIESGKKGASLKTLSKLSNVLEVDFF